jgi:MFS family permease
VTLGRGFWKLWAGNASANLADGVVFISIPLLAAALTSDALLIAGLAAIYSAVRLLVVLPVGVYVDRFDRRSILWAINLARGILLAGAVSAFIAGHGSIVLLYGLYAFLGVLETVADNAALSILPDIVPAAQLDRANGRISAAQLTADEFVGPPLGACCARLQLPSRWP